MAKPPWSRAPAAASGWLWPSPWRRPARISSAPAPLLEDSGSRLQQSVEVLGRRFWGYACDLADRAALYGLIEKVKRECPPVDILVNNGGSILRKPAAEHPDEYRTRSSRWISARSSCWRASSAATCSRAAAERSSSPRLCSAFRAASRFQDMPPPRGAWRSLPRR